MTTTYRIAKWNDRLGWVHDLWFPTDYPTRTAAKRAYVEYLDEIYKEKRDVEIRLAFRRLQQRNHGKTVRLIPIHSEDLPHA